MYPTRLLRSGHGPQTNITGFDIRALRKAAANPPRYDPWEQHEAWRYKGLFTRFNRFKRGFPGLGIATVAFAAYCTYEHYFLEDTHGEHGHHEEHH